MKETKLKKWILIGSIGLVLVILLIVVLSRCGKSEEPQESSVEVRVESKTSLNQILEISELSTVNFTYNAIVKVKGEKDGEYLYYVAYDGNVIAGIDFSKIQVFIDEEEKTIAVNLPEVSIQEVNVDIGSLEYIFVDEDAETENILQEAYRYCLNDLESRAANENEIKKMARANAISAVSALTNAWVETSGIDYTVNIQ